MCREPTKRELLLLAALCALDKATMKNLQDACCLSESTIKRLLKQLRIEYFMKVQYIRLQPTLAHGENGYYNVQDWGIINQNKFIEKNDKFISHLKFG